VDDTQILTPAVSVIVPVSFLPLSNSRISDVKETLRLESNGMKETLRAEIQSAKTELRGEMQVMKTETQAGKAEILSRLDRMEDNLTRLLADHDQRITRLEGGHN
jgi:hypothetical protein